jgi:undecaprenyl-diphosphatase
MPSQQWWQTEWQQLPTLRKDTRNYKKHPLNIQYAGTLMSLQAHLEPKGWQPATMVSLSNILKLLSPKLELEQLPLLPQVHDGHHETLALVKDTEEGKRYVIRLWPAHTELTPDLQPLWIGNVSELKKGLVMELFTYTETGGDFSAAFELLEQDSSGLRKSQPEKERELLLLEAGQNADTPNQPGR